MSKIILITGGTGTIGKTVCALLEEQGNTIRILTRTIPNEESKYSYYLWDPENSFLDENALKDVDIIIHLAGAGIVKKKWSRARKKTIIDSRVFSAELLYSKIESMDKLPEAFISASAIGYYGYDTGSILVKETSRFGDDFLATVVKKWEAAADSFKNLGLRVVKLRLGVVLDSDGGALPMMAVPAKLGMGAGIGRGDQFISWIHIRDLASIFRFVIDKPVSGVFNAVSPQPLTNREFMKTLSKTLNKPFFLPNIPSFLLKLKMGEMASMVLGGNKVSAEKIQGEGFTYEYNELKPALENLLKS
jgi:uncharacterized protein (TIGR01777 family)